MQGGSTSARPFLRKLAAALPANFVVFWLVLGGLPTVLLLTAIGATLGAVLLTAVDRPWVGGPARDPLNEPPRHRGNVSELPRPA
jgi:hypothetical protein